jgi:cytochrome c oxidase cbb3-type subunit 4
MYKQFFQGMDYTHLPLFTLVLFVALFVGMLVHVLFVRRRSDYDAVASLPLTDGPAPQHAVPARASTPSHRAGPRGP